MPVTAFNIVRKDFRDPLTEYMHLTVGLNKAFKRHRPFNRRLFISTLHEDTKPSFFKKVQSRCKRGRSEDVPDVDRLKECKDVFNGEVILAEDLMEIVV